MLLLLIAAFKQEYKERNIKIKNCGLFRVAYWKTFKTGYQF